MKITKIKKINKSIIAVETEILRDFKLSPLAKGLYVTFLVHEHPVDVTNEALKFHDSADIQDAIDELIERGLIA